MDQFLKMGMVLNRKLDVVYTRILKIPKLQYIFKIIRKTN